MPYKARRPCKAPGCPSLVDQGFCDKHHHLDTKRLYDDSRPSAAKRGYGHRWRKLRRLVLNRQPVCKAKGCNRFATDVDHIVPKNRGGDDSMDNLQGLCHSCHSVKTATEDGAFGNEINS